MMMADVDAGEQRMMVEEVGAGERMMMMKEVEVEAGERMMVEEYFENFHHWIEVRGEQFSLRLLLQMSHTILQMIRLAVDSKQYDGDLQKSGFEAFQNKFSF